MQNIFRYISYGAICFFLMCSSIGAQSAGEQFNSIGEYKKVIGCWPIKYAVFVFGDYSVELRFNMNGGVSVKEWGDEARINNMKRHQAYVYMANQILLIKGKRFYLKGEYRINENKLFANGVSADEQMFFTGDVTKRCPSILLSNN